MDISMKVPPGSKSHLTDPSILADRLAPLVGAHFPLTGITRTDGAAIRRLVAHTLGRHDLPLASTGYKILPKKGVPRILREFIDTYLVTTGTSYNLQVWNRNPAAHSVQIEYDDRSVEPLLSSDVRFVFVRVHPQDQRIRTVVVMTPAYIEENFGAFGKATIKQQLIISSRARQDILTSSPPILYAPDHPEISHLLGTEHFGDGIIRDQPEVGSIRSLAYLRDVVAKSLIGKHLPAASTKVRGQSLEQLVARMLGYQDDTAVLLGSYPDLPHQALEVKVQDGPTVDLGRFTPQFEEPVQLCPGFTTRSIRYLIALTNTNTSLIEGVVLMPGAALGDHFAYVAESNFKSQRAMPMTFFDRHDGMAVFNPTSVS